MAGRVVFGGGVPRQFGGAQFVDVAVAVDANVIGDVDPAALALVKPLVLAQPTVKPAIKASAESLVTALKDIFKLLKSLISNKKGAT